LKVKDLNLCLSVNTNNHGLWHKRLGHLSDNILNKYFDFSSCNSCDICKLAKKTILSFPLSISKSDVAFELIHSDIWGPSPTIFYNGFKYFIIFLDDFFRPMWLYLL
jgi:GAG-pre-integrase domain